MFTRKSGIVSIFLAARIFLATSPGIAGEMTEISSSPSPQSGVLTHVGGAISSAVQTSFHALLNLGAWLNHPEGITTDTDGYFVHADGSRVKYVRTCEVCDTYRPVKPFEDPQDYFWKRQGNRAHVADDSGPMAYRYVENATLAASMISGHNPWVVVYEPAESEPGRSISSRSPYINEQPEGRVSDIVDPGFNAKTSASALRAD